MGRNSEKGKDGVECPVVPEKLPPHDRNRDASTDDGWKVERVRYNPAISNHLIEASATRRAKMSRNGTATPVLRVTLNDCRTFIPVNIRT